MKRFPLGLTLSAVVAFSILLALGGWQLRRLAWKQDLLARVAALQNAPAQAAGPLLGRAAAGADVEYQRIGVNCAPAAAPAHAAYRYAVRDGEVGWRLLTVCRLDAGPYDSIIADRGVVSRFAGAMAPQDGAWPAPAALVGVLRSPGGKAMLGPGETTAAGGARVFRVVDAAALAGLAGDAGLSRPAHYLLAVEKESPAPAGVVPAALPQDIPNNHLTYALTWFALAAILAWFYAAMLLRRLRP